MLHKLRDLQASVADSARPFLLLALRVVFGYALFRIGWAKLHDLERLTGAFTSLGIPMPAINARVVAVCEAAGGILIMAGLATRIVASVLVVIMSVALLTAHRGEVTGFLSAPGVTAGVDAMAFWAMMVVFSLFGPGIFSADYILDIEKSG